MCAATAVSFVVILRVSLACNCNEGKTNTSQQSGNPRRVCFSLERDDDKRNGCIDSPFSAVLRADLDTEKIDSSRQEGQDRVEEAKTD